MSRRPGAPNLQETIGPMRSCTRVRLGVALVTRVPRTPPREDCSPLISWRQLGQAVGFIGIAPKEGEPTPSGRSHGGSQATGRSPVSRPEKKKTLPSHGDSAGSHFGSELARDTGFETVGFTGTSRTFAPSTPHLRAPLRVTPTPASGEAGRAGAASGLPGQRSIVRIARLGRGIARRSERAVPPAPSRGRLYPRKASEETLWPLRRSSNTSPIPAPATSGRCVRNAASPRRRKR